MVKVVPTNAVAMPESSSSIRTRSTASRDDPQVVERQLDPLLEDVGDRDERGVCRVRSGDDRSYLAKDGEVADGDDVHSGVSSGIAVGAELGQQAGDVDAGLLGELAPRGLVQCLVRTLEPTGHRPHSFERLLPSPDEKDVEHAALGHGQDDHVHRDGEGGKLARVVPRRDVRHRRSCRHDSYSYTEFRSCQPKPLRTATGARERWLSGRPVPGTRCPRESDRSPSRPSPWL